MLLLLTESTLFFLDLALATRATPDGSHVMKWATHVAGARQLSDLLAELDSTTWSSSLLPYRPPTTRSSLSALSSIEQNNEVFSDSVDAADEKAATMAIFKGRAQTVVVSIDFVYQL